MIISSLIKQRVSLELTNQMYKLVREEDSSEDLELRERLRLGMGDRLRSQL